MIEEEKEKDFIFLLFLLLLLPPLFLLLLLLLRFSLHTTRAQTPSPTQELNLKLTAKERKK